MTLVRVEQLGVVFLVSAVGCLLIGSCVIRGLMARRWIQPIRYEDCPPLQPYQHAKQGTPTMGGLLVLGIAISVAVVFGGVSELEGWLIGATILAAGALGMMDDLLKLKRPNANGLRSMPKLMTALGIGGMVGVILGNPTSGYRHLIVPWLNERVEVGWWWIPLAMAVVAGCAHAVNLTDGMDGLAVGCLSVAFGVLGLWTLADPSHRVVAIWCASLMGACVGFLWFNSFPASVFLGDVGALGLGAALGVLSLCSHAALLLVIVGGIFVAEAVSVMLQVASYRWRNKRRLFRVAPLHHHFHLGGVHEQKLVVRFWIVGLLLGAVGLTAFSH